MQRLNNFLDSSDGFWGTIKVGIYTLFAFLNINIDIVNILCWLILIDIFTGFLKTMAVPALKFTFKELYIGLMTKLIIILIPMTLALVALGLGYDFRFIINSLLKMLIVSEGISIFTNAISVKKRRVVQNKDYLHIILVYIRNVLVKFFDNLHNATKEK